MKVRSGQSERRNGWLLVEVHVPLLCLLSQCTLGFPISALRPPTPRQYGSENLQWSPWRKSGTVDRKFYFLLREMMEVGEDIAVTGDENSNGRDQPSVSYPTHILQPPSFLQDLQVGESMTPFEPLNVQKISSDPPIFVLQNFMPDHHRDILMEATVNHLHQAECKTKDGENVSAGLATHHHREGSSVAWIDGAAIDTPASGGNEEEEAVRTARVLTQIARSLFVNDNMDGVVQPEPLQVVRYEPGGKFDLHHDGLDRTVTVLTYLNGIAGTWFPFVNASLEDFPSGPLSDPESALGNKRPGKNGIWILGEDEDDLPRTTTDVGVDDEESSFSIVRIREGDAVVFYNYVHYVPRNERMVNWKAIHCALPAPSTKWIATNWFGIAAATEESD